MNSVAQVAMGILILGTAFVFGIQMHDQDETIEQASTQQQDNSEFVWQKPKFQPLRLQQEQQREQQPVAKSQSADNGLIDMPVARKRVPETSPSEPVANTAKLGTNQVANFSESRALYTPEVPTPAKGEPMSASANPVSSSIKKQIVEPDFSRLAMQVDPTTRFKPAIETSLPRMAPEPARIPINGPVGAKFDPQRWSDHEVAAQHNKRGNALRPELNSLMNLPVRTVEPSSPVEPSSRLPIRSVLVETNKVVQTPAMMEAMGDMVEVQSRETNGLKLSTNRFVHHKAQPGESLQMVSRKYFGKPDFYLDIYLANQDVLQNPAHVPVGATLRVPVYE